MKKDEILRQVREGEQKAQFQIYKYYFNTMYKTSFDIVKDDEILNLFYKALNYQSFYHMGYDLQKEILNKIINPLKENLSLIKRFSSFEFGELDLNPKIKKKYAYDPTGV